MQENNLIVNSSPSKTFFIDMITKDVSVESAILDLIDNAIDSHKKHKKRGEKSSSPNANTRICATMATRYA